MKEITFILLVSISILLMINGCQSQNFVFTALEVNNSKLDKKTLVVEENNCGYNLTYPSKEECKCNGTWITNRHAHSFCTPSKTTTYSCRITQGNKIKGEVNVFFKAGTTLEEAEQIVHKNGGKILIYTCWFENRDDPHLTAFVGESMEQIFISLVQNESIVSSAFENFFASAGI